MRGILVGSGGFAASRVSTGLASAAQARRSELTRREGRWLSRGVRAVAAATALALALTPPPLHAQNSGPKLAVVRDAETEQLLRDYALPLFRAAGLNAKALEVILINDMAFNAFVASGQKIFINVGALMDSDTPNEIVGVIAHETGHIAGGHQARLRDQIATAKILSVAGMLLGAGAVVGAARSGDRVGNTGTGAMGAIVGPQEMIRRSLLSYQRSEEQTADQAAIRYLKETGHSPKGMLTTFRRFADTAIFRSQTLDPYLMSHPLPAERVSQLETLAKQSPHFDAKDSPALQARHDMVRAKLYGVRCARRHGDAALPGPQHLGAGPLRPRYLGVSQRAFLGGSFAHRRADPEPARQPLFPGAEGPSASRERPRPRSDRASTPSRRGLAERRADPRDARARARRDERPRSRRQAVRELSNATQREPDASEPFQHLATAYGRKGNIPMAELAAAQAFMNSGDWQMAHTQASRAMAKLKPGSPAYLKAEDIMNARPPGKI